MRHALHAFVCALALGFSMDAHAQTPFNIDDLLAQESLGNIRISPDSRWVVIDREAAWDQAASYDLGQYTAQLLTRLEVHDASGQGPVRRVQDPGHATGYISGPFSPDGGRMIVYRLTARTLRLGVMTLSTGSIRWHDLTPEWPNMGQTIAWRSDHELVLIARPDDDLPLGMRHGWEAQARASALWAVAAAGRRPSSVALMSGANRDAHRRARPSALIRLDVATGAVTTIARGEFFDFTLSPDRQAVAAMAVTDDIQTGIDEPVLTGTPARRRRLTIASLDSGRVRPSEEAADYLPYLLAWSPDSRRVLTFRRQDDQSWTQGRFTLLDRTNGDETLDIQGARPHIDVNGSQIPYARGTWDGNRPVVLVESEDGARFWRRIEANGRFADITARPGQVLAQRNGHLLVGEAKSWRSLDGRDEGQRPARAVSSDRAQDEGGRAAVNPDPVAVADWVGQDEEGCLVKQTAPTERACLGLTPALPSIVAASQDLTFIIETQMSATGSTVVRLRNAEGVRPLLTLNGALDDRLWGEIRPVEHAAPDGTPLTSWLLLPPGGEHRELPVVMIIYPGTTYSTAPTWLRPGSERRHINPALLAAAGYAILVPSLPLYDGTGQALDDLAPRLEAILDRAAETGLINPDRAAVLGHSYGGYGAMTVATQSRRFRAIVASAGRADLTDLAELPPQYVLTPENGVPFNVSLGWAETGQGRMGASLVSAPQRYIDASPIYRAAAINTPILMLDGDMDFTRGRGLFGALYRMDREAGLVTYAGEGHVFVSPANIRDLHSRIIAWLDRYLSASAEAGLPVSHPALEDANQDDAIVLAVPNQMVVGQDSRK